MKKSLIALAALAATGAFAQSSVTLYGTVDIGVQKSELTSTAGVKSNNAVVRNDGLSTSNIGFKGEKDLGNGLKAGFVYEIKIDSTEKTFVGDTRNGTLFLSGGFGTISAGYRNTLMKNIENAFDANDGPTSAGYLGDDARDTRRKDMVTYSTPVMSGFSADLQVGLGGTAKTSTNSGKAGDTLSVGLNYVNGPLTIKAGTETVKESVADVKMGDGPTYTFAKPTGTAGDRTNSAVGASYDLGVAKLYVSRTEMKSKTSTSENVYNTTNGGVRVPMGAFTLAAGYSKGEATVNTAEAKSDIDGFQLSVWYTVAKDLVAYAIVGQEKAKNPEGFTWVSDAKRTDYTTGLRYRF